jgi:hypothetical protein
MWDTYIYIYIYRCKGCRTIIATFLTIWPTSDLLLATESV